MAWPKISQGTFPEAVVFSRLPWGCFGRQVIETSRNEGPSRADGRRGYAGTGTICPAPKILLVTPDVETYPGPKQSRQAHRPWLPRWRETEARKHWGAFGAGHKSLPGRCHNLLSGSSGTRRITQTTHKQKHTHRHAQSKLNFTTHDHTCHPRHTTRNTQHTAQNTTLTTRSTRSVAVSVQDVCERAGSFDVFLSETKV